MSNVSPLSQRTRAAVVVQSQSASAPMLNANTCAFQRWPQLASPAASTATAAQLVPSFTTHQAYAVGPNKSGLPHTPAAQCLSPRRHLRQALQFKRFRGVGASRSKGKVGSSSRFLLASFQVSSSSFSRPGLLVAPSRLLRSITRKAKPAEMQHSSLGPRALPRLRANPSVKRTSCGKPQSAAYFER
jgi:hypothetical protein